jgi:hypothetical protein
MKRIKANFGQILISKCALVLVFSAGLVGNSFAQQFDAQDLSRKFDA